MKTKNYARCTNEMKEIFTQEKEINTNAGVFGTNW